MTNTENLPAPDGDRRRPVLVRFSDLAEVPFNAGSLYALLLERGIVLRVEGDRIRWIAPAGAMTVELIRAIKRFEAELVELVDGSN